MNQVAVVIGGGQTLGPSSAVGLQRLVIASPLWIFRVIKPQMWRRRLTPRLAKAWRTVLAPMPPASRAFWRSLAESMKFLAGLICWSTAPGIAKAAFISDSSSAISTVRYR
ncbi:Uncharacterised protein [Citrobacter koseri]|nr:Uncharacterised protein [Citrobacter koseri]